jgi:TonB family protein
MSIIAERIDGWDRASVLRWSVCLLIVLALHVGIVLAILLLRHPGRDVPRPIQTPIYMDLPPLPHSQSPPAYVPGLSSPSQLPTRQPPPPPSPPLPPQPRPQAAPLPLPQSPAEPTVTLPPAKQVAPSIEQPNLSTIAPPPLVPPTIKRPTPLPQRPRQPQAKPMPRLQPAKPRPPLAGVRPLTPGTGLPSEQLVNPAGRWMAESEAYLDKFKRFQFWPGMVVLQIEVDRRGRILRQRIIQSSGIKVLDQEALETLQRARALPPPPPEVPGAQIDLMVHVYF